MIHERNERERYGGGKRIDSREIYEYSRGMAEKEEFITEEEKKLLEKELQHLKEVERVTVINQLQVARSYGDLRENSEYDTARKRQAVVETRIGEIERELKSVKIKKESHGVKKVTIGNVVEVEISKEGKKTFSVGVPSEKHPEVSPHSPIAEGLLGKKVGEVAVIQLPKGQIEMKVLKINA